MAWVVCQDGPGLSWTLSAECGSEITDTLPMFGKPLPGGCSNRAGCLVPPAPQGGHQPAPGKYSAPSKPAKITMPTQLLCRKARKQGARSRLRAIQNSHTTIVMATPSPSQ